MKRWEELGNERFKLTIMPDDPTDTTPPSVYRGTKDEIADLLAQSQENANRRIAELRPAKPVKPNGHAAEPAPLTPADRMQIVSDLGNPATVDRAITRVVESQTGVTMEEQRQRQQAEEARQQLDREVNAAMQWAQSTPEWFDSEYNKQTIVRFMKTQGLSLADLAHYNQAFEVLSAAKLLQVKSPGTPEEVESENEDERERNAPVPVPVPQAPRRVSTGVMQSDISGLPPRPTTRLKYTREQISDMSAYDYKQAMLSDPEFSRCVEWYAQQDRQQQRRRMG